MRGGGGSAECRKKTVRELLWGVFFFSFFFSFLFSKAQCVKTKSEPGNRSEAKWSRG